MSLVTSAAAAAVSRATSLRQLLTHSLTPLLSARLTSHRFTSTSQPGGQVGHQSPTAAAQGTSHTEQAAEAQPHQPRHASTPPQQQPQQHHWLDHYFPSVRPWLEEKNRLWWVHGLVKARPTQYHQLQGREALLRQAVEAEYQRLMQRHAWRVVDTRAETHLQVAALALATHRALLPFLRDEGEVLAVVSEHVGHRTTPLLRTLMRVTKFLQRDAFATLSFRLRGLQMDYGAAFQTQLQRGERLASLTVSSCFYQQLFEEEGVPQLISACCCSQDRVWLEGASYKGVQAGLASSMAAGDACCRFQVVKL